MRTTLIGSIDLAPTILAATKVTPETALPGLNLLQPDLLDERDALYGALFAHTAVELDDPVANLKFRYTVREDGWKLILPYLPNKEVALHIRGDTAAWMNYNIELYNVLNDPFETTNLADDRPELVNELTEQLEAWWAVYE